MSDKDKANLLLRMIAVPLPIAPPKPPKIDVMFKLTQIGLNFAEAAKNRIFNDATRAALMQTSLVAFTLAGEGFNPE